MDSKTCTRCQEHKPLNEFAADKRASTGTQSACKRCQAEIRKQRREKDREAQKAWVARNANHVRAKRREYQQATKERRRELERARYWLAPEKHRAEATEYRTANADKVRTKNRERLRQDREQLGPIYVAKVLGMRPAEIPKPLMALKKEQLTIRRLARQLREGVKDESIENGS